MPCTASCRCCEAPGNTARITRMVNTAFGGSLLLGVGAAAVLLVLSVFQAFNLAPGPWWIGVGLALAVFAQLLAGVPYNVALGEGRFNPLGRALAFAAAVDLVASVLAGLAWGAAGAVLVGSFGLIIQFVLVRELISWKPRFRWDVVEAKRLAFIGIPIALIWFSNANFIAVDKVVALVGLGKSHLGLYTLATAASSLAMVGPVAIATRFGPRVLERIGESSAGQAAIEVARTGVHVAVRASAIVLALGLIAIPGLTSVLLPEYVPAIRAAQILLAGGAILASTFPLTTYLIGRGLQWRVVRVYAAAAAINLALDAVLLWMEEGITGIAVGSLVSYALFSVAVQRMVAALDGTPHAMWKLARAFWPLVARGDRGRGGRRIAVHVGPGLGPLASVGPDAARDHSRFRMGGEPGVRVLERERQPARQEPRDAIAAPAADGEEQGQVLGGDGRHRRSRADGHAALVDLEAVPLERGAKPLLGEAAVVVRCGVVALHEGDVHEHAAAWLQHAVDLRQGRAGVVDMLEHGLRDAAGERRVGERAAPRRGRRRRRRRTERDRG